MNRESIHAEDVFSGLTPVNYRISHKDVKGKLWINNTKLQVRFFTFENCTFNDEVILAGFDDLIGFHFIDCTFSNSFIAQSIIVNGRIIDDEYESQAILI